MTTARQDPKTGRLTCPLVLVGLMGAGKTSVGRRLAAALDVPFWDSDVEVEAAAGMTVAEVFERFGEPYFRAGERRVIERLLGQGPGVLATGGGAFMDETVRGIVAQAGVSVWLKADLDTLWDRVRDRTTRPLLLQPNPRGVLERLVEQRYPVYALADITVDSLAGIPQDQMVKKIIAAVTARDEVSGRAPVLDPATV